MGPRHDPLVRRLKLVNSWIVRRNIVVVVKTLFCPRMQAVHTEVDLAVYLVDVESMKRCEVCDGLGICSDEQ